MQSTPTNQPYRQDGAPAQPYRQEDVPVQSYRQDGAPVAPVQTYAPAPTRVTSTSVSTADRIALALYVVFGVLEGLIAIRILLKLFGANADAGFSAFIYNVTAPFVGFFNGVFGTPTTHGNTFEISSVLALVVYALVGWGVVRLTQAFGQRQTTTTTP